MTTPKRFIAVADSHAAKINPHCENAVMDFIKDFRPTVRIHLGDAWDLEALREGATPQEQEASIKEDFDEAKRFLYRYYKGGEENYYLEGNHDRVRIERFARSRQAIVQEAAADALRQMTAIQRRCKCVVLPYDSRLGVLRLGHLKAVHGYASGETAVRKHARVYGNVLLGHIHTIESVPVENPDGPAEARAIGALCHIDMSYNSRQLNKLRHANGFAYGYLFEDGSYQILQAREIAGVYYAAPEMRPYGSSHDHDQDDQSKITLGRPAPAGGQE